MFEVQRSRFAFDWFRLHRPWDIAPYLRDQSGSVTTLQVRQERQATPVFQQRSQVQAGLDAALPITGIRDHLTVRINDHGASVVNVLRIAPNTIDTHNVRLVLN